MCKHHLLLLFVSAVVLSRAEPDAPGCAEEDKSLMVQLHQLHQLHEDRSCKPSDLGCRAQNLACELANRILVDFAQNPYIFHETYERLTELCGKPKRMAKPSYNWLVNSSAACATNAEDYNKKNPATRWHWAAARAVAKSTVEWIANVTVKIKPFVAHYVDAKLEQTFHEFWNAEIQGIQNILFDAKLKALDDSRRFPNGTLNSSQKVVDAMHAEMNFAHELMLDRIPQFTTPSKTSGAYLSQFAALHLTVIANLWSSYRFRTPGSRHSFQSLLGCYSMAVFNRSVMEAKKRMAKAKIWTTTEHCSQTNWLCPNQDGCDNVGRIHCADDWEGCRYELSGRTTACIGSCSVDVFCRPYEEYAKVEMDCHVRRNGTRDQMYWFW
ncbi:PTC1, partial [Symbiodinium sp. CCMP2456]